MPKTKLTCSRCSFTMSFKDLVDAEKRGWYIGPRDTLCKKCAGGNQDRSCPLCERSGTVQWVGGIRVCNACGWGSLCAKCGKPKKQKQDGALGVAVSCAHCDPVSVTA